MEVIILAGGLGTRLSNVVNNVPKSMAPIAGKPFLFYLLNWLTSYKVEKVILSVGYLRNVIFEWFEKQKNTYPFSIEFSVEEEPMGTGGGIKLALEKIQANEALILNGDTFYDVNLDVFFIEHKLNNAFLSIALKPMRDFDRYGNVIVNNNIITEFKEKQYCTAGLINGGIYLLQKKNPFFDLLPPKFSFESCVLQPYCPKGLINGFVHDNYFIDIGIPEDYEKANQEFTKLFQ